MNFEKFYKEFEKCYKGGVNYSIEKIDDYNFKIIIENEVKLKCNIHENQYRLVRIEDFGKLNEYLKKELNTDLLWSFYEKYLNYPSRINVYISITTFRNLIDSIVWDIKKIKKYASEKKEEDIKRIIKTSTRDFVFSGHLSLNLRRISSVFYINGSDEYSELYFGDDREEIIKHFKKNKMSQKKINEFKNLVNKTFKNEVYYKENESILKFNITNPFESNKLENMEKQLIEIINEFEKK